MQFAQSLFDTPSPELLSDLRAQQRAIESAEATLLRAVQLLPSTVAGVWSSAAQRRFSLALDDLRAELTRAAAQLFAAENATSSALSTGCR